MMQDIDLWVDTRLQAPTNRLRRVERGEKINLRFLEMALNRFHYVKSESGKREVDKMYEFFKGKYGVDRETFDLICQRLETHHNGYREEIFKPTWRQLKVN